MIEAKKVYASGAQRCADVDDLRHDLLPPSFLRAVAARYGLGAVKYGDNNWQKGFPFSNITYHMMEHLTKFREGSPGEDTDVQNLAAVAWGCSVLIHYLTAGRTELDDRGFKVQHDHRAPKPIIVHPLPFGGVRDGDLYCGAPVQDAAGVHRCDAKLPCPTHQGALA